MILVYNADGVLIGTSTTYDHELLAALVGRLARAEGEREQARADLAALQECYDDRDRDLEYEYIERMAAEARCEAWYIVAQYAEHEHHCAGNPCSCGLAGAADQITRVAPVATPHGRIVALGRAALAYERARKARSAEGDVGTDAALRAVYETRRAYLAALAEAMETHDGPR